APCMGWKPMPRLCIQWHGLPARAGDAGIPTPRSPWLLSPIRFFTARVTNLSPLSALLCDSAVNLLFVLDNDDMATIDEILRAAVTAKASDVHINVGAPPLFRINTVISHSDF